MFVICLLVSVCVTHHVCPCGVCTVQYSTGSGCISIKLGVLVDIDLYESD